MGSGSRATSISIADLTNPAKPGLSLCWNETPSSPHPHHFICFTVSTFSPAAETFGSIARCYYIADKSTYGGALKFLTSTASLWPGRNGGELQHSRPTPNMLKDTLYALRALRQNTGFALTAILSIALAVGANSTIFSVANGLLLRP